MSDKIFKPGELFVYVNGSLENGSFEIGKVKSKGRTSDYYFCFYHQGSTASATPVKNMHKLINAYVIDGESLGSLE